MPGREPVACFLICRMVVIQPVYLGTGWEEWEVCAQCRREHLTSSLLPLLFDEWVDGFNCKTVKQTGKAIISSILQMRKLKLGGIKKFARDQMGIIILTL